MARTARLPGFGLTLGFTLFYLSLVVLIPIVAIFARASSLSLEQWISIVASPRALASYRLSLGASFLGGLLNVFFGLIVAWVLVRYKFRGRRVVDALVDLPFAMPTAVSGIALTAIYSQKGLVGQYLEPLGIKVAFTPLGVVLALTFIGLPFVVRTVQPVLESLEPELEEAAATLGASRLRTFSTVVLPPLLPALITGFTLAFARGLGEYGSVVFISGNLPLKTEITPLLIMTRLEQYDYRGATALGVSLLVTSFFLLLVINGLQWYTQRRVRGA
jgi:sulfate transport system permease protein